METSSSDSLQSLRAWSIQPRLNSQVLLACQTKLGKNLPRLCNTLFLFFNTNGETRSEDKAFGQYPTDFLKVSTETFGPLRKCKLEKRNITNK